jgi:hypothetical protein
MSVSFQQLKVNGPFGPGAESAILLEGQGPGGYDAERFRGSRPEAQATPQARRCLVAVLDEGELAHCGRKDHSSRGTPISYPGVGGAVSLPQASAAKSRLTIYLCCSAGKYVLEPRGSLTDGETPLCLSGRTKGLWIARLFSFQAKSRSADKAALRPGPGSATRMPTTSPFAVASATSRFLRSSARLKTVRGWPCEVDAPPPRGRDGLESLGEDADQFGERRGPQSCWPCSRTLFA